MRTKIIISEPTLREMCRKYRRSRSHKQYAPSAATSDVFSRKEEEKSWKKIFWSTDLLSTLPYQVIEFFGTLLQEEISPKITCYHKVCTTSCIQYSRPYLYFVLKLYFSSQLLFSLFTLSLPTPGTRNSEMCHSFAIDTKQPCWTLSQTNLSQFRYTDTYPKHIYVRVLFLIFLDTWGKKAKNKEDIHNIPST